MSKSLIAFGMIKLLLLPLMLVAAHLPAVRAEENVPIDLSLAEWSASSNALKSGISFRLWAESKSKISPRVILYLLNLDNTRTSGVFLSKFEDRVTLLLYTHDGQPVPKTREGEKLRQRLTHDVKVTEGNYSFLPTRPNVRWGRLPLPYGIPISSGYDNLDS